MVFETNKRLWLCGCDAFDFCSSFLVHSAHPPLTLRSVDFRSMHPKCVSVVGVFLWGQCAQESNCSFLPPKCIFNGPINALTYHWGKWGTPLTVNDSSVKVAYWIEKTKCEIRFHLLLMYRVIPHMRNGNFLNKYGDLGNPQYLEIVKDRNFVVDAHIEYNMY